MLIERPPRLFRTLVPGGIFRMPSGKRGHDIYLTFDDGPIPEATPWVLDTLDRYGVKATFFMVGDNARRYPELAREVAHRGHRVGNHTMHHLQGVKVTTRTYLRDVSEAQAHVCPEEGATPHTGQPLFRPPHGWLRPRQARALRKHYRVVMYDLVSRDYSRRLTAGPGAGQREAVCPPRVHSGVSRLAEEPAANKGGAPGRTGVAYRTGIRVQTFVKRESRSTGTI